MARVLPPAALVLAVSLLVSGCGPGAATDVGSEGIAPEALAERLEENSTPLILDVRTPAEYAEGHVPGAVNVPHTEVEAWLAGRQPATDTEVVVYCETGPRAARAEAALRDAGFERLRHLEGNMRAWRARDLPCAGC